MIGNSRRETHTHEPNPRANGACPAGSDHSRGWAPFVGLAVCLAIGGTGCSTIPTRALPRAPGWSETRTGPFRVESSHPMDTEAPAVQSLGSLESRLRETLELEPHDQLQPIRVLVLDNEIQLARLMHAAHPELPARRAFFVAEGQRRTIYTYQGERLIEDLRHEATHALIHATVGVLPLWLDEGLAEYFEVDPSTPSETQLRARALLTARRNGWSPDLARLESMTAVRELGADDYREAWAWVHLLIEGPEKAGVVLDDTLRSARAHETAGPSLAEGLRMELDDPEGEFWRHLEALASPGGRTLARAQSPSSSHRLEALPPVLLAPPIEPTPRRSFLGRLADGVGDGFRRLFRP